MTQFYTYAHKRADDGKIFYIGKGKDDRKATNVFTRMPCSLCRTNAGKI